MRNVIRAAKHCSFLALVIFASCQKTEIATSSESQTTPKVHDLSTVSQLLEEKVRIPKGVDENAIRITSKSEAAKFVEKAFANSNGRLKAASELDPDVLSEILVGLGASYPSFDFSNVLPADQFNRILADFPDIKTQEEAYNKRETIALYYENRLRHDFIEALKTINSSAAPGGRVKAKREGSNSLPGGWGWLAATYPASCYHALQARDQINAETSSRFPGGNQDGNRSNAFRHAGWCGLTARKNIANGASKQNGVHEAGIVSSAFECVSVNFDPSAPDAINMVRINTKEAAMDLFNNSIGRSYIYHNTTFGAFGIRKDFPSEGYFLGVMYNRNCTENEFLPTATTVEQILGWVTPNPADAWNILYRHTQSGWYSFVRLYDTQGCN